MTISCLAIGILGSIGLSGLVQEGISKIFMFAAIVGFIGTIILVGENLKRNSRNLERVKADTIQADIIWKEADYSRPSRFLIFGFISTVLLGLTLFMNPQAKTVPSVQSPVTPVEKPLAVPQVQTPPPKPVQSPLPPVTKIPKKTGNGGIFVGGNFK